MRNGSRRFVAAVGDVLHLAKRAIGSVSDVAPSPTEAAGAREILLPDELVLWSAMSGRDQRHSLVVLARFDESVPGAPRAARAAALLHDVGKTASMLGWWGRIAATIVGPRGRRFRAYHDHERLGAGMLTGISDPETVRLIVSVDGSDEMSRALRAADRI